MRYILLCLIVLTSFAYARGADIPALLNRYCIECHDNETKEGGHSFQPLRPLTDGKPEL